MDAQEWKDAFGFICSVEFWRMGVLWTLSLIYSYLQLFRQTLFSIKSKTYSPRCSPSSIATKRPICIVTGATSGLGAAAACALSREGYYVVLVGRSVDLLSKIASDIKEQSGDACVKAFQVDLSSFKSIWNFKREFQHWLSDMNMHCSVQLLINNAGILATRRRVTTEGCDKIMATNYVGAFCLTKILLPLLQNSPIPSRVVNVTSFTHRNVSSMKINKETISGKCFSGSRIYPFAHVYEYSKLCLLLFSYELHRQVKLVEQSSQVSVIAVDPGAVKTNIMRELPKCISQLAFFTLRLLGLLQSSEEGVCSILDAAFAPPEISGVYFFGGNGRTLKSSPLSYNSKLAKDLWEASSDLFIELQLASGHTT
ncbi:dehydrogenase/reductase SDR family member on chromosome X-like isoform X1 [Ipomoea triloba]|uniref:dehydrogenase/reductase SDR family member on chromosome X-like isoform X1 n=1 Tax=Ipomoea triloba TaxID=35885 RepID=UPI00125D5D8C|nr:dehydrogenase/reductase SDR family member on chromosome X-like isoform X1 [Ipomoea triloba]